MITLTTQRLKRKNISIFEALKQRKKDIEDRKIQKSNKSDKLVDKKTENTHTRIEEERSDNRVVKIKNINCVFDYEIFAYCSQNYKDCYDFVINSWLKQNVKKITVYTDFEFVPHDPRIEIIPIFKDSKSSDWLVGTGRRLDIIKDFIEKRPVSNDKVFFLFFPGVDISPPGPGP